MGRPQKPAGELGMGTLDLLILSRLAQGPMHGFGIADSLHRASEDDVLRIEEGSLYPALHRLEAQGLISSSWGQSENNRRARYYALTPRGRTRVTLEVTRWRRLVAVINSVVDPIVP